MLIELPLFSPYFSIKSEYQNTSAFDFFLLQNTFGIENVPPSKIALRYYRDSVTVILMASSLQTYVMSHAWHGTDCHAESPSGRGSAFQNG